MAEALRLVRATRLMPLYGSVEEALEAAVARPAHLLDELRLAPIPTAAAVARDFVREVCRTWQLARPDETVVDRAVLVANELVTNAVVHAGSDLWLRLELRADRIFISVRDANPRLLRSVIPDLEAEGGRGLWLVEQLARAWGSAQLLAAARSSGAHSASDPVAVASLSPGSPGGGGGWSRFRDRLEARHAASRGRRRRPGR